MKKTSLDQEFLKVIEANQGLLHKVARIYCHKKESREDLIQEITLQLWKAWPGYNPAFKMSTWMYRIALNVAISWFRKQSRIDSRSVSLEDQSIDPPDDSGSGNQQEEIEWLYKFIDELKELDKALILLYLEEKNHEEIAVILGISKSNVATKIGRIKQRLAQRFDTLTQS